MAYDQVLAERVRVALGRGAGIRERKMFGGLAFLLNGNFAVSAYRDGGLMMPKVLITGATGFIGRYLMAGLANEHEIIATVHRELDAAPSANPRDRFQGLDRGLGRITRHAPPAPQRIPPR